MKKTFIIIGLLNLSLGTVLKSQDVIVDPRGNFTMGIKAGVNYSNVWDGQGQDFKANPKIGFAGGLFFGIPIGKFLGFQPEVLLSQKGFEGSGYLIRRTLFFFKNNHLSGCSASAPD